MFIQATTYSDQSVITIGENELAFDPVFGVVFFVAIVIGLFLLGIYLLRRFYHQKHSLPASFKKVVIRITVPKESSSKHTDDRPTTADDIKSQISSMEAFFSSIGGLKAERGFHAWLHGREDSYSFEVVSHKGVIVFYIAIPEENRQYIEQQLLAQFPESHIEQVEDYNVFTPNSKIVGSHLFLSRQNMFPIKSYTKMEVDPLNSITNALSKIESDDGAIIQILVRSAYKKWHRQGMKVASEMQQGKKLEDAISATSFSFLNLLKNLIEGVVHMLLTPKKNKDDLGKDKAYTLSPMETKVVEGLEEKTSKAGLDVNIRIVTSSKDEFKASMYLKNIVDSFNQYNIYQYGNSFKNYQPKKADKIIFDTIHRIFDEKRGFVLNSEEIASIYHLPLPSTETPSILWLSAKKAPPPVNLPQEGLILGKNVYRGQETVIRIKEADRRRHMYIIGKSGTGKSVFLTNMARQDILAGKGICVIDPHGDLVDDVLEAVPKERAEDVIVFDPSDTSRVMGLNLIEYDPRYPEQKTFVINELIKIFDKLYDLKSTGGPMFEQYMRNTLLLLLDDPNDEATLMEVSRVLADSAFRKEKLVKCQNQMVKDFWTKEAEKAGGEASLANMVPYITSKLTQFVANDIMRPIIGQSKSAFNFRQAMDEGKIILVKLSKGQIGELNAHLLGMVFVGKILMASLSRTDVPKEQRRDFYLYIDEFQNFTTDSIAIILSEARKYMLNLIIAHQYIGQLVEGNNTTIKDAVFGNAGTIVSFKIGSEDAESLAKEFAPVFNAYDLLNIEKYTAYVKLLVDNEAGRAFNMNPLYPEKGNMELAKNILQLSKLKYGRDRKTVEAEILARIKGVSGV